METAYNRILVEFDMLVDLDLAIFKYIKDKYNNPDYVDQNIIKMNDEKQIIQMMLNRQCINPLEILIPDEDVLDLYYDIINNHINELLKYAKASDLFGLMITFLNEASSLEITVLCKSKIESDFIKSLNNRLDTVVYNNYKNVPVNNYTVLYIKYYPSALQYNSIEGKHIYISNARYNMEPDYNIPTIAISGLIGDVNIIHMIDMYRNIKVERIENHE